MKKILEFVIIYAVTMGLISLFGNGGALIVIATSMALFFIGAIGWFICKLVIEANKEEKELQRIKRLDPSSKEYLSRYMPKA